MYSTFKLLVLYFVVYLILTGYTDVESLVEAINDGQVYRYVTKLWNNDDLWLTVRRALAHHETNKARHELEMRNHHPILRLQKIQELATLD